MDLQLYPYQTEGVAFLRDRPRALLYDEMGLGKTVQAIVAASLIGKETLVICPAAVVPNWEREIAKWADRPDLFTVTSYASLHRIPGDKLHPIVIADEWHYAKNPKAKRTKRAGERMRLAEYAWALTGTPIPNGAQELYTTFHYLFPEEIERCATWWKFVHRYAKVQVTRFGTDISGHNKRNAPELREKLDRLSLRRKVADISADLPELRVDVDYLPKSVDLHKYLTVEELEALQEGNDMDEHVMRSRRLLGLAKAPYIAERLAEELDDGAYDQIVVMFAHHDVGDAIQERLHSYGVVRVDGKTRNRQAKIDMFTRGEARVFLGQQVSTGTGINLQAARELVLVEPYWTPALNQQAIKRIHRLGQDHPCRARMFCVPKTLDEGIIRAIAEKTATQEALGVL